jgi:hypothetical protein
MNLQEIKLKEIRQMQEAKCPSTSFTCDTYKTKVEIIEVDRVEQWLPHAGPQQRKERVISVQEK